MKKLMILGASILQLPAIQKAKEMGLQVIAVDMDKNAIGFKDADMCEVISTIDVLGVVEAAKRHKIDGVITLASDKPMRTVAAVATELGIVGINEDTALKATNKALMRECLRMQNVPIPLFYKVDEYDGYLKAIQQFTGKIIVKPADNSGSRGVFLVEDLYNKELINYAFEYSKKNSYSGEIIVEEYMEGHEVSVETLSLNGKVNVIAITDKITTGAPRFVEIGHSQPARFNLEMKERIEMVTKAAVKAIGIENGPSHTEIIITNEGPKIVELGARLGGDNITTHLVPLSTGIDMVKCCIKIALGEVPEFEGKTNMSSAIRYFQTKKGEIKNIKGVNEAELIAGVKQISLVKSIGDKVEEIKSSSDRIGFVVAQSRNVSDAIKACQRALDCIEVEIN